MTDRVGQVWQGALFDRDLDRALHWELSLCVESGRTRSGQIKHRFVELTTGETGVRIEADPFEQDDTMQRVL